MNEPRDALIHNMSAPPRSTMLLRPRDPMQNPQGPGAPSPAPSAWGLAWFGRIDFDRFLGERHPELPMAQACGAERQRLRLRCAVALARSLSGEATGPGACEGLTDAALEDELLDWAARQVPDRSLPRMLMVSPAEAGTDRDPEQDPARLLAFLLHHTGRTCDLGGPPALGAALRDGAAVDLWSAP